MSPLADTASLDPIGRHGIVTLEIVMGLGTVLLILLILLMIGALPTWGYSRGWGYAPTGGLGLALVVVIILLVMGRL